MQEIKLFFYFSQTYFLINLGVLIIVCLVYSILIFNFFLVALGRNFCMFLTYVNIISFPLKSFHKLINRNCFHVLWCVFFFFFCKDMNENCFEINLRLYKFFYLKKKKKNLQDAYFRVYLDHTTFLYNSWNSHIA